MPTYTQEGVLIDPVVITQTRVPLPPEDDAMPEISIVARFDWQFWAAMGLGAVGLYILLRSIQYAGRRG